MWRMIINASLVASFQLLHRTELVNHFSGGFEAVCNCSHGPNLAYRLCYGNRDRIGVDIQTQKAYFTHDQLLSYATLRRFCCLSFAA
jgi:hypothetical protein